MSHTEPSAASRAVQSDPLRPEAGVASAATAPLVSSLQQSRVGRDTQRYDGTRRLLACAVVVRQSADDDRRELLLISSSKHPGEWILPKGGWEEDETAEQCALREAEEEAGVAGEITRSLGELDYATSKGKPCRFYAFELKCTTVYDEWAEQTRQRKWVSWGEALALLARRQELLDVLHLIGPM